MSKQQDRSGYFSDKGDTAQGLSGEAAEISGVKQYVDAFRDRLKHVIETLGMDRSVQISKRSSKTLGRYIDGNTEPPFAVAAQLAIAAGMPVEWLATGNEPRDSPSEPSHVRTRTKPEQEPSMLHLLKAEEVEARSLVLVPRLDVQASAGTGLVAISEDVVGVVAFEETFLRRIGVNPKAAHITTGKGDSMFPTIRDGDLMIIDTSIDRVVDEGIYNVVLGGRVLVKRLQIRQDGTLVLRSDNKAAGYEDVVVAADEVHELHVVGRLMWNGRSM